MSRMSNTLPELNEPEKTRVIKAEIKGKFSGGLLVLLVVVHGFVRSDAGILVNVPADEGQDGNRVRHSRDS